MSSSRGFFVGQLVDDLASISHQVKNRCSLNMTDLSSLLENFFANVLNILEGLQLKNLNGGRSNEPGLDLGDETKGIAFQITSTATSAKINHTLDKITTDQAGKFDKFRVLIIGEKQKSYSLNGDLCTKYNFSPENIWDITDLARKALTLPIAELQELHRLVSNEVARVRVELELIAPDGTYPTDLRDFIEAVGKPTRSDGSVLAAADSAGNMKQAKARALLDDLANKLAELPRISREFYAFLFTRKEVDRWGRTPRVNGDLVSRLSSYPDTDGELRFLEDRGFISFAEPREDVYGRWGSHYWHILLPGWSSDDSDAFFYFLNDPEGAHVDLRKVLVLLDFSAFGPPPVN